MSLRYFVDPNGSLVEVQSGHTDENGTEHFPDPPANATETKTPPQPPATSPLENAQRHKTEELSETYNTETLADIQFTSADGSTKTYQADRKSRDKLHDMLDGFAASQQVPSGFFWVAKDNTQVPFTYADLQNLAEALAKRDVTAFTKFQTGKNKVKAAKTEADVKAVPNQQ